MIVNPVHTHTAVQVADRAWHASAAGTSHVRSAGISDCCRKSDHTSVLLWHSNILFYEMINQH